MILILFTCLFHLPHQVQASTMDATNNFYTEDCSAYLGNYTGILNLNRGVEELRIDAFETVHSITSAEIIDARISNNCGFSASIIITHQNNGTPQKSQMNVRGSISVSSDELFLEASGVRYRIDNTPNNLTDPMGKKISGLIVVMDQYTLVLIKSKVIGTVTSTPKQDGAKMDAPAPPAPEEKIYDLAAVQEQPNFPGGMAKMYAYLHENTKYPEKEFDTGIQGKVYIEFIVEKDGTVKDVKLRRGVSPGLDEEALRAVEAMPMWTPGKMNGKPVRVRFTIPVDFKLK